MISLVAVLPGSSPSQQAWCLCSFNENREAMAGMHLQRSRTKTKRMEAEEEEMMISCHFIFVYIDAALYSRCLCEFVWPSTWCSGLLLA